MDQHPSGIDDVICFILHCACILGIEKYDVTIDNAHSLRNRGLSGGQAGELVEERVRK